MPFSIRSQILIPILGIQAAAVISIALTTATLSTWHSEQEIVARLNGVIDTLDHANFPYTAGVLTKMRGLSGAHYAVITPAGRIVAATLADLDTTSTPFERLQPSDRLESLRGLTTFVLHQTRYFAAPLRMSQGPESSLLLLLYPETSWRKARWEAATPSLFLGLGTLGVMALVTSWVAERIGARIRQIQEQVASIAAGNFARIDPGRRVDEVQELATSVNRMCDHLVEMQQIIRQSERTRLLAQLAAGLAHQLRNSLTGARMSIQLHAKRSPPRAGDDTLGVALRQLAMTEEQVRGLLSLGRVGPGRRTLCELNQLLSEIALLVGPSCEHAGVALQWHESSAPCSVVADEAGLRSAVLNMTLNAIEAASPGGKVELRTGASDDELTIEVSDTGLGPPPEIAATLLEPFVTSKPEGVGLGLAIANQVAAEHGGRISWRQERGCTRFCLTLPRGAAS